MNNSKRKLSIKNENCGDELTNKKHKIEEIDQINEEYNLSGCFDDPFDEVELCLTEWQRCEIESVELINNEKVLHVKDKQTSKKGICYLQGSWCFLKLHPLDTVTIRAVWDSNLNKNIVSSEKGYIIHNPDYLISGTSVVGSLFCLRKGVLSDRFKGIDSGNKIMTIGSLVHELFQTVLRKNLKSMDEICSAKKQLLSDTDTVFSLYANSMTFEETSTELNRYIPNIFDFVKKYTMKNNCPDYGNNFMGKIDILDIEENIWLPNLGLKGKIDVTVKVDNNKTIPLEVKTGRSSFALEHKGQLGLYQTMMNEFLNNVESGLLVYLKDGITKEIKVTRNEQRDLIMLRNELSYYLVKDIVIKEETDKFDVPILPEPINHHNACSKCPYNIICCSYLSRDEKMNVNGKHPLKIISKDVLFHLTEADIDYFIKWTGLVSLENEQIQQENKLKHIWTKTLQHREQRGSAIGNLIISGKVTETDNRYLHVFTKHCGFENKENLKLNDMTTTQITIGEYVIISTSKRFAIATGHVQSITKNLITILLERNLNQIYKNNIFFVDKYVSNNLLSSNLTNLGALIDDTEASHRLRKIIIDKKIPNFEKSISRDLIEKGKPILLKLNQIQRRAVLKAVAAEDYVLLKGLPGTGKTQTLIGLIQILVLLNKSVLVTSHTNSAVDNVLLRLKEIGIPFLRLGSSSRIHADLQDYTETNLLEGCKTPNELETKYNEFKVMGITCYGSSHPILSHKLFDVCIVDESTQVFQMSIIRPLLSAKKFVLVGDPDQLPPIIKSNKAKILGADESLFSRLDSEQATCSLTLQYRMNQCITNLANKLTYKGSLTCATTTVANSTMIIPNAQLISLKYGQEKWLLKTLSTHIDQSVIIIDTDNVFHQSTEFEKQQKTDISIIVDPSPSEINKNSIYINYCEAALTIYIINALIKADVGSNSIGIISPFRSQVALIKESLRKYNQSLSDYSQHQPIDEIEVNTVDQYQGRDKQLIIYSCTKSFNKSNSQDQIKTEAEILDDHRRLTVAITRAKHKLIMIGDFESLQRYSPFVALSKSVNSICKIKLIDGRMGFTWNAILNYYENILNEESDLDRSQINYK